MPQSTESERPPTPIHTNAHSPILTPFFQTQKGPAADHNDQYIEARPFSSETATTTSTPPPAGRNRNDDEPRLLLLSDPAAKAVRIATHGSSSHTDRADALESGKWARHPQRIKHERSGLSNQCSVHFVSSLPARCLGRPPSSFKSARPLF